jgi:hypothetical protein
MGRALAARWTEITINDTTDFRIENRLANLPRQTSDNPTSTRSSVVSTTFPVPEQYRTRTIPALRHTRPRDHLYRPDLALTAAKRPSTPGVHRGGWSMTAARRAVHRSPVWRERSNFIITTMIDSADTDIASEQLWARKIDDWHFELCCIPFFAYDLALGDVVETDGDFLVRRVSTPSGRYVFRVHFDGAVHPREEVTEQLESLGALLEWSSANLLAVDARNQTHAQVIADFLHEREGLGQLIYETGKMS